MSRCPFAAEAVEGLIAAKQRLKDRLTIDVDVIGVADANGLSSPLYGEGDIAADKWLLCAKKLSKHEEWVAVLSCQNTTPETMVERGRDCARLAELDSDAVERCVQGPLGEALVRESFLASGRHRIEGSPTLFIGQRRYVGGLTGHHVSQAVCSEMGRNRAAVCDELPSPPALPITLLVDRQCREAAWDTSRFRTFVDYNFPGAQIREVDARTSEGELLLSRLQTTAPAALFGPGVQGEVRGFNKLRQHLERRGDDYLLVLR